MGTLLWSLFFALYRLLCGWLNLSQVQCTERDDLAAWLVDGDGAHGMLVANGAIMSAVGGLDAQGMRLADLFQHVVNSQISPGG